MSNYLYYKLIGGSFAVDNDFYKHIIRRIDGEFKANGQQKISRDEHETITKLKLSVYPTQCNDYFLLKIPKFHEHADRYVPIDHKLKGIILNLWKLGIETLGSDQGCSYQQAFISIKHNLILSHKSALLLLVDLFGEKHVRISHILKTLNDADRNMCDQDKKQHPDKIYFIIRHRFIRISFEPKNIEFVNSLFKNHINSELKCHKGNVFRLSKKNINCSGFVRGLSVNAYKRHIGYS